MSKVRLNWKAYFDAFSEAHGGDPVLNEGRLLFRDGWTYACSSYAGPEWPPETKEDELRLRECYWRRRLNIVLGIRTNLAAQLDHLRNLQSTRKVKLKQVLIGIGEDGFRRVRRPERDGEDDVDFAELEDNLSWHNEFVAQCNAELAVIEEERRELLHGKPEVQAETVRQR